MDGHPQCEGCGETLYGATEIDILRHKVLEFKLL